MRGKGPPPQQAHSGWRLREAGGGLESRQPVGQLLSGQSRARSQRGGGLGNTSAWYVVMVFPSLSFRVCVCVCVCVCVYVCVWSLVP